MLHITDTILGKTIKKAGWDTCVTWISVSPTDLHLYNKIQYFLKTVRKNPGNTDKLRQLSNVIHCKFSSAVRELLGLYLNTASYGHRKLFLNP